VEVCSLSSHVSVQDKLLERKLGDDQDRSSKRRRRRQSLKHACGART